MRPDSLLKLWRYVNHLLTYLLVQKILPNDVLFSQNAQRYRQTDGEHHMQQYDHAACSSTIVKNDWQQNQYAMTTHHQVKLNPLSPSWTLSNQPVFHNVRLVHIK